MTERLRAHNVSLADGALVLRPMTEDDWDILFKWNSDREVLYFAGDDESWTLPAMQAMYRGVSERALTFVAELDGVPAGECWLQEMNLEEILSRFPKETRLYRIDLMIGDKDLWGRGLGTRMIALLVRLGFETQGADAVFGCGIADYNSRSMRAFEKNGFVLHEIRCEGPGKAAKKRYNLILTRAAWQGRPSG